VLLSRVIDGFYASGSLLLAWGVLPAGLHVKRLLPTVIVT
jgi:hypothetical protein